MKRNRSFSLAATLLTAMCVSAGVIAADDEDDDEIEFSYEDKLAACAACHGQDGKTPLAPDYPRIAGQHESYLAHALKSYRSKRRVNAIMNAQTEILQLSDSDIKKLAAHYAALPGLRQVDIDDE